MLLFAGVCVCVFYVCACLCNAMLSDFMQTEFQHKW